MVLKVENYTGKLKIPGEHLGESKVIL